MVSRLRRGLEDLIPAVVVLDDVHERAERTWDIALPDAERCCRQCQILAAVTGAAQAVAAEIGAFVAATARRVMDADRVGDNRQHLVAFVREQRMPGRQPPALLDETRIVAGELLDGVVRVEADQIGHLLAVDVNDSQHLSLRELQAEIFLRRDDMLLQHV